MINLSVRYILAFGLIFILAGCSSLGKKTKTNSSASSNPFLSSSKKVQQDFSQTETDLGQLESQVKVPK